MNFFAFDINLFAFDIDFLAFIFLLKFRFVGSHFLPRQTMRGLTMRDRIGRMVQLKKIFVWT